MSARRGAEKRSRRILVVIGQSGMGDGVEALPTFELIRDHWPDAHLTAGYFRESQAALLETSPHISELVRLSGGVRFFRRALAALPHNTRAMRGYDEILFLYKLNRITWPMLLAAKLAGGKVHYRHGYRYSDDRRNTYSDFPEHVFFQIVTSLLLLRAPLTQVRAPRICLPERDERFATDFFERRGLRRRPVVIINTQSLQRGSLPDWGVERYAEVARALVARTADVIINGGVEHQVQEFRRIGDRLPQEVTLLERASPRELAAVIARCDLYVGAANGPASVAMAVGTPAILLVGPGEHRYHGQERIGPVWWPRDPIYRVIAKVEQCEADSNPASWCRAKPERLKRALRRLGLWEPWRALRKTLLEPLGLYRHRGLAKVCPCLDAISVEEVVEAAKVQLAVP